MSNDIRVLAAGRSFAVEVLRDERWETLAAWEVSKLLSAADAQREVDVWIALVEKTITAQLGRPIRLEVPKFNP